MAIETILLLGGILLACACAGLFFVRIINPRLLGLGWLGGCFASGGTGALLLLLGGRASPLFSVIGGDCLILFAFFLLHVAVIELLELPFRPTFGLGLLALQFLVDLFRINGLASGRLRVAMAGLLIAIQAAQTARVLLRDLAGALRAPRIFCASLLLLISASNLLRSLAIAVGRLDDPAIFLPVEAGIFILFVAVALGIAFAFFWMTTTNLTVHLERMASTDPLTRIYNRPIFLNWCHKEWQRAQYSLGSFSILMLDLDHFKQVNDRFGHHAGDDVLCAVVERLQDAIRGIDVLGRWGGEEFVVLLPNASREAAALVAQRVRTNIEKSLVALSHTLQDGDRARVRVTASVGVATYQGPSDTVDQMLRRADAALYKAKALGRNQVKFDPPALASVPAASASLHSSSCS